MRHVESYSYFPFFSFIFILFSHIKADSPHYLQKREGGCGIMWLVCTHTHTHTRRGEGPQGGIHP